MDEQLSDAYILYKNLQREIVVQEPGQNTMWRKIVWLKHTEKLPHLVRIAVCAPARLVPWIVASVKCLLLSLQDDDGDSCDSF